MSHRLFVATAALLAASVLACGAANAQAADADLPAARRSPRSC